MSIPEAKVRLGVFVVFHVHIFKCFLQERGDRIIPSLSELDKDGINKEHSAAGVCYTHTHTHASTIKDYKQLLLFGMSLLTGSVW